MRKLRMHPAALAIAAAFSARTAHVNFPGSMKNSDDHAGGDMRKKTAAVVACLMLVLVSSGCGQGNWQDTGSACTGTDWKTAPADQRVMAAKLYQKICGKEKVASDLRCRDKRMEVECK